ncbi:MAG: hypothetical protein ABSC53_05030 [Bacteroidota bacterium]
MGNESTHFIFDGEKIVISPDLYPIVAFLQEIEKEIDSFLGFDKRLESIRKQYSETIDLIQVLANKLKENSIDFNFTFSEHPASIADKFKMYHPVRSKMIILFANLEVLLCLNIAYENKTSEEKSIINKAMKPEVVKSFYDNFCLSKENDWGQKNPERLERITADDLRKLRNSLTHFFSVARGVQIADAFLDDKSRKLEHATNYQVKFISPADLYGMIKGSGELMIKRWSQDCKECLAKNSNEFKEKILSVKALIDNSGVICVKNEQINI